MNYIDKKFYSLVDVFERYSKDELFKYMRDKYLTQVAIPIQEKIESFLNKYKFWGNLNLKEWDFDIFARKAFVFKNNLKDIVWLYEKLQDNRSKYVFWAVLNNYFNFDFNCLQLAKESVFKHYWDLDLINCHNKVIVDVGAYYGDSLIDFVDSYGEDGYEKYYCYEITKKVCDGLYQESKMLHDVIIKNKAVGNENKKVCFEENLFSSSANQIIENGNNEVDMVCLDDDIQEKVDLIKMDIEGGEKNALMGCRKHIKEDKPILLISVYHNNTDLFEIPRMIHSLNSNYRFYLRYYGGNIYATEIVLFCL